MIYFFLNELFFFDLGFDSVSLLWKPCVTDKRNGFHRVIVILLVQVEGSGVELYKQWSECEELNGQ